MGYEKIMLNDCVDFSNNQNHFRLHMDILDNMKPMEEAEDTIQELITLSHSTTVSKISITLMNLQKSIQD